MKGVCGVLFIVSALSLNPAAGQTPDRAEAADFRKAVLYLTGAGDMESVGEYELQRLQALKESPVPINLVPRARLEATGLFSDYQTASLMAYREENGDILSFPELALVDGFGAEMAEALPCFVSLESSALPGNSSLRRLPARYISESGAACKAEFPAGSGFLKSAESRQNWWTRLKVSSEGRYDASVSFRRDYDAANWLPTSFSAYAVFYGRKTLNRFILGDYSLRFGQGLALWSGFSMTGWSGFRSFWKRPSGISPSGSLSAGSSHSGMAASLSKGRYGLSVFVSVPALKKSLLRGKDADLTLLPGFNAYRLVRNGRVSLTSYCVISKDDGGKYSAETVVSADARFCLQGKELFAEAAYDFGSDTPAVTAGCAVPLDGKWKVAFSGLYMPDGYGAGYSSPVRSFSSGGEYGASAGVYFGSLEFTAAFAGKPEMGREQVKAYFRYPWKISENNELACRIAARWRSGDGHPRADLRLDYRYAFSRWRTAARVNALKCRSLAGLAYVEEGFEGSRAAVWLRETAFAADNWDDRMYSYERDAPGSFNVPAYYGRGFSLALVGRMKLSHLKLWLRCAYTSYRWTRIDSGSAKPSRLETRLMLVLDLSGRQLRRT